MAENITPKSFIEIPYKDKINVIDDENPSSMFGGQGDNLGDTNLDDVSSEAGTNYISIILKQSNISLTTGDGTTGVAIPAGMNGKVLTAALARIYTLGSSGTTTVQVRRRRGATSADMLSTGITVSFGEYYASDGVINLSNDDIATGDEIFVDVDTVATGSKGLSVVLTFG